MRPGPGSSAGLAVAVVLAAATLLAGCDDDGVRQPGPNPTPTSEPAVP